MTRTVSDKAFFESVIGHHDSVDLNALLRMAWSRWYWIVMALAFTFFVGWLYYRLIPPKFTAQVTLKYLDKHSELDELGQSRPAYLFSNSTADYLTEKYNVKSQAVVAEAIKKLQRPFTYYRIKDLRSIDVYPFQALQLAVLSYRAADYEQGQFDLKQDLSLHYHSKTLDTDWKPLAGDTIQVPGLRFKIVSILTAPGYHYRFTYNDPSSEAKKLIEEIRMVEVEEAMPVMHLSFTHRNQAFTLDFTKNLIDSYQNFDLQKKRHAYDITLSFIKHQLAIYADSLRLAAQRLETFKQSNRIFNLPQVSQSLLTQQEVIATELQKLRLQRSFLELIGENLSQGPSPFPALSMSLDPQTEASFTAQLNQYNQIFFKKRELLLTYHPKAPPIVLLDDQLLALQSQIRSSLTIYQNKNKLAISMLQNQYATLSRQLINLPQLEKNQLYLQSNFDVNQRIYSLLRDKDIESSIIRAGILPTFAVITSLDIRQDAPQIWQIMGISLLLGLALGAGALGLARTRNPSFDSLSQLDHYPDLPLWAVLHRYMGKHEQSANDLPRLGMDRSIFSETVNLLRSRISLGLAAEKEAGSGQQILITSQMAGEGKTFIALNLALSLARLGRSVLLIGADLRKPQLGSYFAKTTLGISDFCRSDRKDFEALIHKNLEMNIDYIDAGSPTLHPGELIQSPSFTTLLSHGKRHYQYVIVDSAPLGLVADTLPLLSSSDITLFVVRWLRSDRHTLAFAQQMAQQYKGAKLKIVLNAYYSDPLFEPLNERHRQKEMKAQYGLYKSDSKGYYQESIARPWYKRLFDR